jgi:hypothetical protein
VEAMSNWQRPNSPHHIPKKHSSAFNSFFHSREIANPHPSPDTFNRMESAHPNTSPPSPPMPAASPALLDMKIAAATDLAAAAGTHIPLKSIGLLTRHRTQVPSQITNERMTAAAIGSLASGLKRKRLAPPLNANKGATKKGAKYVVSKK